MAICKSCGYKIPNKAKKCAHCGADLAEGLLRRVWVYLWKFIATIGNFGAILASIATCVMALVMISQTKSMENQSASLEMQTQALKDQAASIAEQTKILKKNFELAYIPVVKIGPISFNFVHYNDGTATGSIAMYFTIPIENRHGYAYNVKIKEKVLTIIRGKYGLETPCMQSTLTKRPFELSPGQIRYEKIGIDENVPNFEKFRRGEVPFKLEYVIEYEAMPEVQKGAYVYKYAIEFRGGEQEVIRDDTVMPKLK